MSSISIGFRIRLLSRSRSTSSPDSPAQNGIRARDAQFKVSRWLRGKSLETFVQFGSSLGPADVAKSNGPAIALRINGETKQDSRIVKFVCDGHELDAYISEAMTIRPGNITSTGISGGVGIFRDPTGLIRPMYVALVEIANICAP